MLEHYRNAFDYGNGLVHLNNAGVAPWSRPALAAVTKWAERMASEGAHCAGEVWGLADQTRASLGRVLGADASQIAFFQTCANAISQVAFGFHLKAGDEIIVWDQEYPSNFFPWKLAAERVGAKLIVAKSETSLATPVSTLASLVTPRTRVIAVSWVQYRTGAITDLAELAKLARAHNIFTCVDIIQGAGVLPFDFRALGLDAVCGGSLKWLTSPVSLGFLVMKPEHFETLTPLTVGANSFGGPDILAGEGIAMVKGFQRFEPGGRSSLELIGLGESLKLIEKTSVSEIAREAQTLAARLSQGLKDLRYSLNAWANEQRGAIVNFSPSESSPAKTLDDIDQRLQKAKVSYTKRAPGVRLSPHAYLTHADIDFALEALS